MKTHLRLDDERSGLLLADERTEPSWRSEQIKPLAPRSLVCIASFHRLDSAAFGTPDEQSAIP